MIYLIETTEIHRADTEREAIELIQKAKADSTVTKYSCNKKQEKKKGEVIDEYYKVSVTKKWGDIKGGPYEDVHIEYKEGAF